MLSRELVARTALLVSIAGIALLFLTDLFNTPAQLSIGEISKELEGEQVKVKARVSWNSLKNNVLLFGLYDGNSIKAVIFSPSLEQRALVRNGLFLEIEGKVQLYNGELEIVAEQVGRYE